MGGDRPNLMYSPGLWILDLLDMTWDLDLSLTIISYRHDKKCCGHLMGVGDGCLMCRVNPRAWNDPEALKEDWPYELDRDLASLKRIEAGMMTNEAEKYSRGSGRGDWGKHEGCTRPPITLWDINPFTITHKV